MTKEELAGKIDLTVLNPAATVKDIEDLAKKALIYPFATLCVPPCYASVAARALKGSPVRTSTVLGFPLGYNAVGVKRGEALKAVMDGASELDMVMNIALFKSGELRGVEEDISGVVKAVQGALIKVIIEACYLTDEEKLRALEISVNAGAHFVKTSTGFGPKGATVEDVRLLSKGSSGRIRIKAAGGIKTLDEALRMIEAGADRLGTSSGLSIVAGLS